MLASSAFAVYSIVAKFMFDTTPRGFTALIVVATFLAGVHLFFLGVIGEYVGRIYEESKRRPLYVVGNIVRREQQLGTARLAAQRTAITAEPPSELATL